ncbi:MAG: 30S ribosome-binding factor RbfA [Parcubacteria group bacterium]|nr:30S ribosome-binding factor RbfA [Parcubacteria group bacterium]
MRRRVEKLNELIKRELGQIIQREFEHSVRQLITITEVSTSEDLLHANVKVSIWPEKERQEIFKKLSRAAGFLQSFLNKRLRMRPVPKIIFELDTRIEEASRVEELIEKVKNKEG